MAEETQMFPTEGQSPGSIAGQAWRKLKITLEMIKVEHSVFALPFALTGAMLAAQGWPNWSQVFWIVVAMVGARSAAMTFNRIADRDFDARNPRTVKRALPAGHLTLRFAVAFTAVSSALLVLAAWELNPLAFKLSPVALALLLLYSYTKRFTLLSHIVLGMCLGLSPVAAWIALRGEVSWAVIFLGVAVTLWVAGFDIIYACQDVEFDHTMGLHSIPKKFGIAAALYASAALHILMLALLVIVAQMSGLGWIALGGLVLVAALLAYEHLLVKPSDLSRVNAAFFTINGYISVLFFLTWAAAILVH
jgi:4-hydroxybenzoate polyprenyltransferase